MKNLLSASLKSSVDDQVAGRGYGSCSAHLRELIRHDQDRQHRRSLLLAGDESEGSAMADTADFKTLRARVRQSSEE